MKNSRYSAAPSTSGVGLPELLVAEWAMLSTSLSAITEPSAVFLMTEITRLVSGGTATRSACGICTYTSACNAVMPHERAASRCPTGSERKPAQMLSSAYAASTSDSARQVAVNADMDRLMKGNAKKNTISSTSGGSARNTSANITTGTLAQRLPLERTMASNSPISTPLNVMHTLSAAVMTKPCSRSGRYFCATSALKKVKMKFSKPERGTSMVLSPLR